LALVGGEWSALPPGIGGWVGPRAGLDDVEKKKFLTLLGLDPDSSVVQPVTSRYIDYAIPGLGRYKNPMTSSGVEPATVRRIA
jgi:hypothetical protein